MESDARKWRFTGGTEALARLGWRGDASGVRVARKSHSPNTPGDCAGGDGHPSLFEQDRQVTTLSHVMDKINRAFGKHSVRFGAVMGSEDTAPTRIAFTRIPEPNPAHD